MDYYHPENPYGKEIEFMDSLKENDVVVHSTDYAGTNAPWGELMSTTARVRKAVGCMCDSQISICITKISTFLILCDLAVCLATLYVSFSLVFALMRYLQGKVFLIRFYSPTTLSSSRAEFRLPSRLACA